MRRPTPAPRAFALPLNDAFNMMEPRRINVPGVSLDRAAKASDADYPLARYTLQVRLGMEFGDLEVPPAAQRRIAMDLLRRLIEESTADELVLYTDLDQAPPTKSPLATGAWEKPPELDLRVVKSAHKIVERVAEKGIGGRAVMASELIAGGDLSAPTVGRLLKEGEPGSGYLARFVRATPHGRTKALDLTEEGRILASRIRAGTVPV